MGKEDYKILSRKARIILVKMPWKRILAFSFCLLLSAIFWFIQVYRQNFTETFTMPVSYDGVPDSVVFDSELPDEIDITIKDNGYALFKYYFTKRNDSIHINIADIINYSANKTLQGSSFDDIVKNKLLSSSELVTYSPGNISFRHTPLEKKYVPVIFDGQVFLSSGYLLNGDIQLAPDSVKVYGPKDILTSLHYAYTTNDTVDNLKATTTLTYSLKKIDKLKFVPAEVQVIVPVDKYESKDIVIPITCINVPEGINVKFFPSSVRVSFLVGTSKFDTISADDFQIQFDYNELKKMEGSLVSLRILSSPDHVQSLAMNPSEAEFIFEKE